MIVDNLDPFRAGIRPNEADTPLIVDPNAVLSGPISLQRLKPIAWWHRQILQPPGLMDLEQLSLSRPLHILRQLLRKSPVKECFRVAICE